LLCSPKGELSRNIEKKGGKGEDGKSPFVWGERGESVCVEGGVLHYFFISGNSGTLHDIFCPDTEEERREEKPGEYGKNRQEERVDPFGEGKGRGKWEKRTNRCD